MTISSVCVLLFAAILFKANGNPLLFFPEDMLPPVGTTYNLTFSGYFASMNVSGEYAIETVTDQDMKTVIGYRNWQSYTGQFSGIFYGVSYINGTYLQALIDPNTQKCINTFAELMNCTSWFNKDILKWDSSCALVRVDTPISGEMSMTLIASTSDLTRPQHFVGTATMSGSPDKVVMTYNFLSKFEQKDFPYVDCYF